MQHGILHRSRCCQAFRQQWLRRRQPTSVISTTLYAISSIAFPRQRSVQHGRHNTRYLQQTSSGISRTPWVVMNNHNTNNISKAKAKSLHSASALPPLLFAPTNAPCNVQAGSPNADAQQTSTKSRCHNLTTLLALLQLPWRSSSNNAASTHLNTTLPASLGGQVAQTFARLQARWVWRRRVRIRPRHRRHAMMQIALASMTGRSQSIFVSGLCRMARVIHSRHRHTMRVRWRRGMRILGQLLPVPRGKMLAPCGGDERMVITSLCVRLLLHSKIACFILLERCTTPLLLLFFCSPRRCDDFTALDWSNVAEIIRKLPVHMARQ